MQDRIEGKRIVVTGGAGFIGSRLLRSIAGTNQVEVLDDMSTGMPGNLRATGLSRKFAFHKGKSRDIGKFCERSDLVFHLGTPSAGEMYRKDPFLIGESLSDMVGVLEYARKNDAGVVLASSSAVYNGLKPPHSESASLKVSDYQAEAKVGSERLCELYANLYGLGINVMRLFSVYGPGEEGKGEHASPVSQFIWAVSKRKHPIIYGDGSQRRDFVFVDDAVRAMIKAAEPKGMQVFNVGTGKSYSLVEVLGIVCKECGRSVKPVYADIPASNYQVETLAETSKASEFLDFRAEVSLEQGISIMIAGNKNGARIQL
ncbi:MAG: NAD-dependent epimerase/dehydratase family protein [Candidatus Micrarchaeaceae archaeon]